MATVQATLLGVAEPIPLVSGLDFLPLTHVLHSLEESSSLSELFWSLAGGTGHHPGWEGFPSSASFFGLHSKSLNPGKS